MAAAEDNPAPEPFPKGKQPEGPGGEEISCTSTTRTPSFVANLLKNDGMTLACEAQPREGKSGEGCGLLMPPSLEELDALKVDDSNGEKEKKDGKEPSGNLLTGLVRAKSPTEEKRSLQPPSIAELKAMKAEKKEKDPVYVPGLKVRVLKKFLLPETIVDLNLDPENDEYWQLWNDAFRTGLMAIEDKNANFFAFQFLKKIFNPLRECKLCHKTRTSTIPSSDNPLELFVCCRGIVGRIKIHCASCDQTEMLLSCDDHEEFPTDPRVQITLEKTRGDFVRKLQHQEVLFDLMELLHIAAMEHCLENKKKHEALGEFLLLNARKVCDQWCRLDYRELRLKKFLQFRREVLQMTHNPKQMALPHRSREYIAMYEIMSNSFRENRGHIHTVLQALKDSLIDNPTRSHCMFWIAIALLHAESYPKFKERYDPRSCMRIDEGEYWALHDRYIGLDAPVGVKKLPVVFILFELPRFYHYIEFLEKACGRRTKIYLTKRERFDLSRIEKECMERGYSRPKKTGMIISPDKHLDFLVRQEELSRMTRNQKFVDAFNKKQIGDGSKKKRKGKKKLDKGSSASKSSEFTGEISSMEDHSVTVPSKPTNMESQTAKVGKEFITSETTTKIKLLPSKTSPKETLRSIDIGTSQTKAPTAETSSVSTPKTKTSLSECLSKKTQETDSESQTSTPSQDAAQSELVRTTNVSPTAPPLDDETIESLTQEEHSLTDVLQKPCANSRESPEHKANLPADVVGDTTPPPGIHSTELPAQQADLSTDTLPKKTPPGIELKESLAEEVDLLPEVASKECLESSESPDLLRKITPPHSIDSKESPLDLSSDVLPATSLCGVESKGSPIDSSTVVLPTTSSPGVVESKESPIDSSTDVWPLISSPGIVDSKESPIDSSTDTTSSPGVVESKESPIDSSTDALPITSSGEESKESPIDSSTDVLHTSSPAGIVIESKESPEKSANSSTEKPLSSFGVESKDSRRLVDSSTDMPPKITTSVGVKSKESSAKPAHSKPGELRDPEDEPRRKIARMEQKMREAFEVPVSPDDLDPEMRDALKRAMLARQQINEHVVTKKPQPEAKRQVTRLNQRDKPTEPNSRTASEVHTASKAFQRETSQPATDKRFPGSVIAPKTPSETQPAKQGSGKERSEGKTEQPEKWTKANRYRSTMRSSKKSLLGATVDEKPEFVANSESMQDQPKPKPQVVSEMDEPPVARKPTTPASWLPPDGDRTKPLDSPVPDTIQVGSEKCRFTKVATPSHDEYLKREHGRDVSSLRTELAINGMKDKLSEKLLDGIMQGKIIPGEVVYVEDESLQGKDGEQEMTVVLEDCTPDDLFDGLDPDQRLLAKHAMEQLKNTPGLSSLLAAKMGLQPDSVTALDDRTVKCTLDEAAGPPLGPGKELGRWKIPVKDLPIQVEPDISEEEAIETLSRGLAHMTASGSKEQENKILKNPAAMALLGRVAKQLLDEDFDPARPKVPPKEKTMDKDGTRVFTEEEKESKLLLYQDTMSTIQALLQSGEADRFRQYIDTVYQEGEMDDVLCTIEKKVCSRIEGKDPSEIVDDVRVSATEYGQIIRRELARYTERKKKKPRIIKPEADPTFEKKIDPSTYPFPGLPGVNSNLPSAAMLCTQLSTDVLRAQGYKVETNDKMVCVIANRTGIIQHIVEGLDTQEEMEAFIEKNFKVPKKHITDGTGCMVVPGTTKSGASKSKGETIKITGNPKKAKKAKKRAKKLKELQGASVSEPTPMTPGKPVTLGGRTYTPDDLRALSEGTHSLMDCLPEVDESVDPFDVESLKRMHPWLKHVENNVMEAKTENECGEVLDKLMTPVPIEGLDPSIPRQVIAYPSNATTPADSVKAHNATVTLANAFMNKMESYSSEKKVEKPSKGKKALPSSSSKPKPSKHPTGPPSTTSKAALASLVNLGRSEEPEEDEGLTDAQTALLTRISQLMRSEVEEVLEMRDDKDTKLLTELNVELERAEEERLEKLVQKKKSQNVDISEEEESRVPHRQMRMLDAMGIPYRLDNIKVVTDDKDKGTVLCKLTLLPFDKSRKRLVPPGPKKSRLVAEALKRTLAEHSKEAKPSRNQKKKAKRKQVNADRKPNDSPVLSANHPPTLDTFEDLKSNSMSRLDGSLEGRGADSTQESTSANMLGKGSKVTGTEVESDLTAERQASQSSSASELEEATRNGEGNRGRVTARDRFKYCAGCSQEIKDRIQLCAGCKKVAYCNSACQKANWKVHKKTCTYAVKKRTG